MQTFLPYRRFDHSARVLDNKRLGKQRVETMQIMSAIVKQKAHNFSKGGSIPWGNHPATKMWLDYAYALMSYQEAVCAEWSRRGFNDTCLEKTRALFNQLPEPDCQPIQVPWLGLKKFHSPHRANLLRKDPKHYGKFGWKEEPAEGYWWP